MEYMIIAVLGLAATAILVATVRSNLRAKEAALATPPFDSTLASSAARESTPPSSDGELSGLRAPAQTPRERMESELDTIRESGKCVVCGQHAELATPKFVHKKSVLDWLHRKMNALAPQRREIQEQFDPSVPYDMCGECQPLARGHLNAFMVDRQLEYATFIERQNQAYREFQRYGLYERMREDADEIKRGKKSRRKVAEVRQLQPVKIANGSGT